jgi:hypothetical protein
VQPAPAEQQVGVHAVLARHRRDRSSRRQRLGDDQPPNEGAETGRLRSGGSVLDFMTRRPQLCDAVAMQGSPTSTLGQDPRTADGGCSSAWDLVRQPTRYQTSTGQGRPTADRRASETRTLLCRSFERERLLGIEPT